MTPIPASAESVAPATVAPGTVAVAYVHSDEVAHSWHQSLVNLIGYDLAHSGRVLRGGWLASRCGIEGLALARNETVRRFLAADPGAEWLWWVDTDMGVAPDTVDRLLEMADPVHAPVVGGLCFAQKTLVGDGMGGYRTVIAPTIFDWTTVGEETGFLSRRDYPVNTLVRAAGTGSACILVHRGVYERIAEHHGGPVWYDRVPNVTAGGRPMGEDLSFCLRAGALGIPVHVHTGVRTTHLKHEWLSEAHFWDQAIPEPAAAETAVIVPVLGRPGNAAPFMASLRASTGLARVYAVVGPEETAEAHQASEAAWRGAGAEVLVCAGVSFAEKINTGYRESREPWLFLVGDDVRFHPGWLDHAQTVAGERFHVVGTNDLGNPSVVTGEHATHLLLRRKYVDGMGASWDGPGVACHEGYRHNFVDNEIVTAAKRRGVWAMALGSRVEHLHPAWGKGEMDGVYELGLRGLEEDRELFTKRCEANL